MRPHTALNRPGRWVVAALLCGTVLALAALLMTQASARNPDNPAPDTQGAAAQSQTDARQNDAGFARESRRQLQSLMDSTVGPHKVAVLVDAELDADRQTTQTTTTTPTSVTTTNQAESERHGAVRRAGTTSSHTSAATRTVRQLFRAPGRLNRLAVTALIDTRVPARQISAIDAALRAAVGADARDAAGARSVAIVRVPFDHSYDRAGAVIFDNPLVRTGLPVGALIACLLAVLWALLALPRPGALRAFDAEAHLTIPMAGAETPAGHAPHAIAGDGPIVETTFESDLETVQRLGATKPEDVALILKAWIRE